MFKREGEFPSRVNIIRILHHSAGQLKALRSNAQFFVFLSENVSVEIANDQLREL